MRWGSGGGRERSAEMLGGGNRTTTPLHAYQPPPHCPFFFSALPLRAGRLVEARALMQEASTNHSTLEGDMSLTLLYNQARVKEALGDHLAAKQGYQVCVCEREREKVCVCACLRERVCLLSSSMHHLTTPPSPPLSSQDILSKSKEYIDCYLRLACMSRRMGSSTDAFKWASEALKLQGGHADALALMSQLYMERR